MKHKAVEVRRYNFTSEDKLFLDANIWLYVYAPQKPGGHWMTIYSTVVNRILKAKSQIYIDVLVVSEFINKYARMEWDLVKSDFDEFKKFRNSPRFKPVAQGIATATKRVLQYCSRVESGFSTLAINNLITDYATGNFDFNDQVITELCISNGLTLITNDSDFKGQGITILTANKRLLR